LSNNDFIDRRITPQSQSDALQACHSTTIDCSLMREAARLNHAQKGHGLYRHFLSAEIELKVG
jgi:hypothetical protein